jgi:hypothetical protein
MMPKICRLFSELKQNNGGDSFKYVSEVGTVVMERLIKQSKSF